MVATGTLKNNIWANYQKRVEYFITKVSQITPNFIINSNVKVSLLLLITKVKLHVQHVFMSRPFVNASFVMERNIHCYKTEAAIQTWN